MFFTDFFRHALATATGTILASLIIFLFGVSIDLIQDVSVRAFIISCSVLVILTLVLSVVAWRSHVRHDNFFKRLNDALATLDDPTRSLLAEHLASSRRLTEDERQRLVNDIRQAMQEVDAN